MADEDFVRIPAKTAAAICAELELDDMAKDLLRPDDSPPVYLDRLRDRELFADAIRFLARGLPKRESVWWACVALRQLMGEDLAESDEKALAAAESWVFKPEQKACETAGELAEQSDYGTPPALAAAGAYWAGETIAASDAAAVPPAEELTATAVANALVLAAVTSAPGDPDRAYREILDRGVQIARGVTSKKALTEAPPQA